jgi:hypothetical protein
MAVVGIVLAMTSTSLVAIADEIAVPEDAKRIQLAIDAASDGDTILVSPGTYFEAIDFLGKQIVIKSIAGPSKTILDATDQRSPAVRFTSSEGRGSVLEGFTIRGGTGEESWHGPMESIGGGLLVLASSPIISKCIFRDNLAGSCGGAVYVGGGSGLEMRQCTFDRNAAEKGGAIFSAQSTPQLIDCGFNSNAAEYAGGAIYNDHQTNALLQGCSFRENFATYNGGGIYNYQSDVDMTDCLFARNAATYKGGAIYLAFRSELFEKGTRYQTLQDDVAGTGSLMLNPSAPRGACCLSGACIVVEEEPCESAGGLWQGRDSICQGKEPLSCPAPLAADLNRDGIVDVRDMAMVMALWGTKDEVQGSDSGP